MYLTKKEKEILDGKLGYAAQKSMEILVALGECYDAKRMIPVTSAHILYSCVAIGKGGAFFIQELASRGCKFAIFTDTNPLSFDPWLWKELGITEQLAQEQTALAHDIARMGGFLSDTCAPYLIGTVPLFGEHIAWNESSAIVYANSVLGARTNREGGPSAMAAAITGRVPEYGYHLEQNRYGDLKIIVTAKLKDLHDYGTLGFYTGKIAQDKNPVFIGIPREASQDALKLLGSAAAASGSVALFHAVGITPEATNEEAAFGGGELKDGQVFEFGERELRETEESLSRATSREVDIVAIGCPHVSITELRDIARLLYGKKVKSRVMLWIVTSRMVKAYAQTMGYVDIIEASSAKIICDCCPISMLQGPLKGTHTWTVATNSAKMTNYMATYATEGQAILPYYGSLERCVNAATTGIWR